MMSDILTTLLVNTAIFTVLFGLMLLLRRMIGKRISAVMQYAIWAVVVIKLFTPFGFESSLSPFGLMSVGENPVSVTQSAIQTEVPTSYENDGTKFTADTVQPRSASWTNTQADTTDSASQKSTTANVTAKETAAQAPLDWTVWAFGIWAAGVLAASAVQRLCTANLRRRARHASRAVPERVSGIFDRCRQEMGIKRHVEVILQSALNVPVIMGAIRPILILPDDIDTLDDAQIKHICVHELTHLKHGDLAIISVLNFLNAVYWFNPFVWVCFRIIRKDMETVCDHRVLARLGIQARQDYIGTVLEFVGREAPRQLYAAMGMADGRLMIEKRIKNMFKVAHSCSKTRFAAICIAVMMLAMSMLTACQPTPEEPPVIPKSEDIPKEAILETAKPSAEVKNTVEPVDYIEPTAYSVNEHWTQTVQENDYLSIEVDADILLPEVLTYPVERLERAVLTQEKVNELIAYFTEPGTKFYTGEYVKLKSEYQEELIRLRQNLQKVLDGGDGESPESIRSYIKEVEQKLADAPESHTYTYVEPVFTYRHDYETGEPNKEYGENTISVSVELPDGNRYGSVSASRYEKGKNTSTSFSYCGFSGGWNVESYFTWYDAELRREMENPRYEEADDGWKNDLKKQREFVDAGLKGMQENNMDLRAAVDKAINLLEELGIEGMQLKSYEKAMFSRERDQEEDYTIPACYVEFVRECGGIPSLSQRGGSFSNDQDYSELYCAPFDLECVSLLISEEGVEYFSWRGMAQIVERVAENTTLMPLDEMKQRILNYVYFMNGAWLDGERGEMRIKIKEMRLVTTYINAKDDPERVLIVPAWQIVAQEEYLVEQTEDWNQGNEDEYMINALDGSGILMPGILEHMQNRER